MLDRLIGQHSVRFSIDQTSGRTRADGARILPQRLSTDGGEVKVVDDIRE